MAESPAHPGEILKTEYVERLGLSADELAESIGIPPERMREIIVGRRAISADTATRLADRLGTTPQLWTGLQSSYDPKPRAEDLAAAARVVRTKASAKTSLEERTAKSEGLDIVSSDYAAVSSRVTLEARGGENRAAQGLGRTVFRCHCAY